jgi:hypothetical protein
MKYKYAEYITVKDARLYATIEMYLGGLPERFRLGVESLGQIYEYCRKSDLHNTYSPNFSDRYVSIKVPKKQSAALISLLEKCLDKDCPELKTIKNEDLIKEILHDASTGRIARSKVCVSCTKAYLKKFSWEDVSTKSFIY